MARWACSSKAYRSGLASTATVASGMRGPSVKPRTNDLAVDDVQSRTPTPPARSPAIRSALARTLTAAADTALPLITAAREANVPTPYLNRRVSPVVTVTRSTGTPSSCAAIWANTVSWPWPWVVSPVDTTTSPVVSTRTWPPSYGPTPVPST